MAQTMPISQVKYQWVSEPLLNSSRVKQEVKIRNEEGLKGVNPLCVFHIALPDVYHAVRTCPLT